MHIKMIKDNMTWNHKETKRNKEFQYHYTPTRDIHSPIYTFALTTSKDTIMESCLLFKLSKPYYAKYIEVKISSCNSNPSSPSFSRFNEPPVILAITHWSCTILSQQEDCAMGEWSKRLNNFKRHCSINPTQQCLASEIIVEAHASWLGIRKIIFHVSVGRKPLPIQTEK